MLEESEALAHRRRLHVLVVDGLAVRVVAAVGAGRAGPPPRRTSFEHESECSPERGTKWARGRRGAKRPRDPRISAAVRPDPFLAVRPAAEVKSRFYRVPPVDLEKTLVRRTFSSERALVVLGCREGNVVLSAALDAAAERRASHIAARRIFAAPRPRPPFAHRVRGASGSAERVSPISFRPRARSPSHALRDLLALRRCFDEMRAPCDDELPFEDDGLLHAGDIERALRALERDRERRPSRRRSAPRRGDGAPPLAPDALQALWLASRTDVRGRHRTDVPAVHAPRARRALAAAADAALNATGSTPARPKAETPRSPRHSSGARTRTERGAGRGGVPRGARAVRVRR